jgi:hypothetical protein
LARRRAKLEAASGTSEHTDEALVVALAAGIEDNVRGAP